MNISTVQSRALAAIITIFLLMMACGQTASATAIAILRPPHEIVIAADSLSVDEAGIPNGSFCKIREVAGVLFTANSLVYDNNGLNVPSIATEALKGDGPIMERIAKFDDLMKAPLQTAVNRILQNDSARKTYILENAVLGINFAGAENNIPSLYGRRFTISLDDPILKVERHLCPGSDCPGGLDTYLVGPPELKQEFLNEHPDLSGNLAEMARKFVQDQN